MPRRRRRGALNYIRLPRLDLEPDTKKSIYIILLFGLGAIAVLGLFDKAGLMGLYLKNWLAFLFGWGRWLLPVLLMGWAFLLYHDDRYELRAKHYIGALLFLFSFQAALFLLIEQERWEAARLLGQGGGWTGAMLAGALFKLAGGIAGSLIILFLLLGSVTLTLEIPLRALIGTESGLGKLLMPFVFIARKLFRRGQKDGDKEEDEDEEEEREEEEGEEEEGEDEEEGESEDEEEEEGENDEEEEDEGGDEEEEESDEDDNKDEDEEGREENGADDGDGEAEKPHWWMTPTNIRLNIPLSLLEDQKAKADGGNIEGRREMIKKAFENFGIPVEMATHQVGPSVTQYTFRPADGIKLSRIAGLSNDLAMALAAHPIRIEAPIPNKSLVGVEVPNDKKASVGLKEVLASKTFRKSGNQLSFGLGRDVAGSVRVAAIEKMPHLLVAGATGSGKSVCLNALIISLMYQNNPDDLRFLMIDPKRVELAAFRDVPYLIAPIVTEVPRAVAALRWALSEMENRYRFLNEKGYKNIQMYNQENRPKMPYLFIVIDELAELMVAAPKEIEPPIIRITQLGRAAGIHAIVATQRPSVNVITGLIKANMPARIAFSVAQSTDSRTILDTLGAEKLLGRGDMLYLDTENPKPVRIQGVYVSELDVKKVADFVRAKGGRARYVSEVVEAPAMGGGGGGAFGGEGDDSMLKEAMEVILENKRASASLLQRRLRVGYARAASILDQLEAKGFIGPVNGAKPREILVGEEEVEMMGRPGASGVSLHRRNETRAPDDFLGEEPDSPPVFKKHGIDDAEDDDSEDEEEEDGGNDNDGEDGEEGPVPSEAEGLDKDEEEGQDEEIPEKEHKPKEGRFPGDKLFSK